MTTKEKTVNVSVKVPKTIWDKFKIKAITKQMQYQELLRKLIEKETKS